VISKSQVHKLLEIKLLYNMIHGRLAVDGYSSAGGRPRVSNRICCSQTLNGSVALGGLGAPIDSRRGKRPQRTLLDEHYKRFPRGISEINTDLTQCRIARSPVEDREKAYREFTGKQMRHPMRRGGAIAQTENQ
jgi:hypothetical protein